ncbi:MAG: hypothetical protein WC652_00980 [archaeon]|jgi:SAM-dependent methyltransferase
MATLLKRGLRAHKILKVEDQRLRNPERTAENLRLLHGMDLGENLNFHRARVRMGVRHLKDFAPSNALLEHAFKGELEGKRILHLGGAFGQYGKFLEDHYKAKVVTLDMSSKALKLRASRGVKNLVQGDAVPERIPVWNAQQRKKLNKGHHIPFRKNSFDCILSENFLFSDYHKYFDLDPGFEEQRHSMKRSQEALGEYNAVLKSGGKLIINSMHPVALMGQLKKFVPGFKIAGFVVEEVYSPREYMKYGPRRMILRKIADVE